MLEWLEGMRPYRARSFRNEQGEEKGAGVYADHFVPYRFSWCGVLYTEGPSVISWQRQKANLRPSSLRWGIELFSKLISYGLVRLSYNNQHHEGE